jgi:bacteriorhodopsin
MIFLKFLFCYLLIGFAFALSMSKQIDSIVDSLRSTDNSLSDLPFEKLKRMVINLMILLWPIYFIVMLRRKL